MTLELQNHSWTVSSPAIEPNELARLVRGFIESYPRDSVQRKPN
jgi:hypothetical protein